MKFKSQAIPITFILLLIISIFAPSNVGFWLLAGLMGIALALGFFYTDYFDDIAKVLGVYLMLILLVETAHGGTAISFGIPIRSAGVTLIGFDENSDRILAEGFIALDLTNEEIDASGKLRSQVSWIAVAGSLILVVFGALYFIRPSLGEFPAIVASIMFFKHQLPILMNDQYMMIQHGWMSSLFAWGFFWLGVVVLGLTAFYTHKHKEPPKVETE